MWTDPSGPTPTEGLKESPVLPVETTSAAVQCDSELPLSAELEAETETMLGITIATTKHKTANVKTVFFLFKIFTSQEFFSLHVGDSEETPFQNALSLHNNLHSQTYKLSVTFF